MSKKRGRKGFLQEFKTFVTRGNVVDLAVGVIIGGAFQKIVNSLVNDIIMPLIGFISGGIDFTNKYIVLGAGNYESIEEARKAGAAMLNYGTFITNVLNFLIMAFVIFLLIKGINKITSLGKKEKAEQAPAPVTKQCPYCKTEINIAATKCPSCTSNIENTDAGQTSK